MDADKLTAALATVQAEDPLLRACVATVRAQRWFKALPQASAPLQPQVLKHFEALARTRQGRAPADAAIARLRSAPRQARKVRVLACERDAASLAALQRQAREHGTTVHGALGAAQLLAINGQFPDDGPRKLALNSLADLRGASTGGLTDRDLGQYIATLCTVHHGQAPPQFWALARETRDALVAIIDAVEGNLIHGVYPGGLALPPGGGLAQWMQAIVADAPASSMLTHIARIEHVDLGDSPTLKSVAFVVSTPSQHPVCVTATSYDGRMQMQLLHDELKLGAGRARRIGRAIVANLREAAGAR